MIEVCPITNKFIDEKVARINGAVTVILTTLFIIFGWWWALLILIVDFTIRGFIDSKYSIICIMSIKIIQLLGITPKMMNAGPKIFAAQIGWVLALIAFITYCLGYNIVSLSAAGILLFFSFLESAFGYCVACKLHPYIRKRS
ncbi:MAG TPA: DUF4395 domain-containing protein [Prolixibacteraceae bacterium]|nr:DUF4395 domain-containing protein [Prolixibacteraceae bacterium]